MWINSANYLYSPLHSLVDHATISNPPKLSKFGVWIFEMHRLGIEHFTRWWFQISFIFTTIWGRFPILTNIFQMGWNHQLDIHPWKWRWNLNMLVYNIKKASPFPGGPFSGFYVKSFRTPLLEASSKALGFKIVCQPFRNLKRVETQTLTRRFQGWNQGFPGEHPHWS